MHPIKISIKSPWYRLAIVYSPFSPEDICQFRMAVIFGLILCAVISIFVGVVLTGPWIDAIISATVGNGFFNGRLAVFVFVQMIVAGGLTIFFVSSWLGKALYEWRHLRPPKPPSTLTQMYRSWKDQYCAPVEFEG